MCLVCFDVDVWWKKRHTSRTAICLLDTASIFEINCSTLAVFFRCDRWNKLTALVVTLPSRESRRIGVICSFALQLSSTCTLHLWTQTSHTKDPSEHLSCNFQSKQRSHWVSRMCSVAAGTREWKKRERRKVEIPSYESKWCLRKKVGLFILAASVWHPNKYQVSLNLMQRFD